MEHRFIRGWVEIFGGINPPIPLDLHILPGSIMRPLGRFELSLVVYATTGYTVVIPSGPKSSWLHMRPLCRYLNSKSRPKDLDGLVPSLLGCITLHYIAANT